MDYRSHSITSPPSGGGGAFECLGPSVPLEFEPTPWCAYNSMWSVSINYYYYYSYY